MRLKNVRQCQTGIVLATLEMVSSFLVGNPDKVVQSFDLIVRDMRRLNTIFFGAMFPKI